MDPVDPYQTPLPLKKAPGAHLTTPRQLFLKAFYRKIKKDLAEKQIRLRKSPVTIFGYYANQAWRLARERTRTFFTLLAAGVVPDTPPPDEAHTPGPTSRDAQQYATVLDPGVPVAYDAGPVQAQRAEGVQRAEGAQRAGSFDPIVGQDSEEQALAASSLTEPVSSYDARAHAFQPFRYPGYPASSSVPARHECDYRRNAHLRDASERGNGRNRPL